MDYFMQTRSRGLFAAFAVATLIAHFLTPHITLILAHLLHPLKLSTSRRGLPLHYTLLVPQNINGRCNLPL
ncbi:hypothetical protein EI94DRAFT_63892 [Lactarius quietus]|nr:hypothetical protein EI94DRAFT_63892 [Lactarius quietus]